MSGKLYKVIFMMLVLSLAFLITAPAFSGEHPWDSDQITKDTASSRDLYLGDSATDTVEVSSGDLGDGSNTSGILPDGWVTVFVQVIYTMSSLI